MTNYEKMQAGELSNYTDAEIVARNSECARLMRAFNATGIDVEEEWRQSSSFSARNTITAAGRSPVMA